MITTDFHLHTTLSVDSTGAIDAMVRRAAELGLTEIAFTDHDDHNPADEGAGLYDPDRAFEASRAVQRQFEGRITIRHGAELGEPHLYRTQNERLYQLPLDVIIGSVHCLGPYGIHSDFFDHHAPADGIAKYFDLMLDMARSADMDIIGHLDYFERYTAIRNIPPYRPEEYRTQIMAVLEAIIARHIALEINTSGFRSALSRPFPHPQIIQWYYQMGGRAISIGSDAHQPDQLACGFDRAFDLLKAVGFTEYHVFHARQPVPVPII